MGKATVFISHSTKDKPIALEIANHLRQNNINIWIDHEQIQPGDSIPSKISSGLSDCDCILVLVSQDFTRSSWCRAEYESLLMQEIDQNRTFVIPVRIDDTELPVLLARKRYVDFRQGIREWSLKELLLAITNGASLSRMNRLSPQIVPSNDNPQVASLLGLVISSVIREFPVSVMRNEHLLRGKSLLDLYQAVDTLIEGFQTLYDEIIPLIAKHSGFLFDIDLPQREPEVKHRVAIANRKLFQIARDMRQLSSALDNILAEDAYLRKRLHSILHICTAITTVEGELNLKFGIPPEVPSDSDLDANGLYSNRDGYYLDWTPGMTVFDANFGWWPIRIDSGVQLQLYELDNYRADLRKEIAKLAGDK